MRKVIIAVKHNQVEGTTKAGQKEMVHIRIMLMAGKDC